MDMTRTKFGSVLMTRVAILKTFSEQTRENVEITMINFQGVAKVI